MDNRTSRTVTFMRCRYYRCDASYSTVSSASPSTHNYCTQGCIANYLTQYACPRHSTPLLTLGSPCLTLTIRNFTCLASRGRLSGRCVRTVRGTASQCSESSSQQHFLSDTVSRHEGSKGGREGGMKEWMDEGIQGEGRQTCGGGAVTARA